MNITGVKCEKHGVVLETKHEGDSCKWCLYCPECEREKKEAFASLLNGDKCSHGIPLTPKHTCEECENVWLEMTKTPKERELESELTALRSQIAELKAELWAEKTAVKFQYKPYADTDQGLAAQVSELQNELAKKHEKNAELQRQLSAEQEAHAATIQREAKLSLQLDEAARQAVWKPLTAPGQIREGMKIRFTLSGKTIAATAKLILHAGTDREEVVYNRAKNHYLITSMAMDGTSSHKSVEFLSSPNLPAIIEQAKAEERERLIFVLENDAFIVRKNDDHGSKTYQLWRQDEDENYYVLHDKNEFFQTPIEAVDAAIRARKT